MKRYALLGLIILAMSLTSGCTNKRKGDYVVLMTVFSHPMYHAKDGQMIKDATEQETGWEDIYLVHEEDATKVFRGPYTSKFKADRAGREVKNHRDAGNAGPFPRATVMQLSPNDIGPKEWRLINNTENPRWTLLVAEYFDEGGFEERKEYAIDYCRELREDGYDAYYFHDASRSYVTIGDFPEEAFQMQLIEAVIDSRGEMVPVAKQVVTDPALSALTKLFPNLAINGQMVYRIEQDMRTAKRIKHPEETYVTDIPKKGESF